VSASDLSFALLNGLSFAMLLFLVAAGLSLIFGLMDVINLTHGVVFMIGAYVSLSVGAWINNFFLGVAAAAAACLVLGFVLEPIFLRPLYSRGHLDQVLVTLGLVYVLGDLVLWTWGPDIRLAEPPGVLSGTVPLLGLQYPNYRLFLAGFGLLVALVLVVVHRRTLLGAVLRAGVEDSEMVSALGIDIRRMFWLAFGVGALLAGLAGSLGAPIVGVDPHIDDYILITSLVVVVVGGLGTLGGSFWGSLVIGMAQSFGARLFPTFSVFLIFACMAAILVLRPHGLVGRSR
jgi:branched-chain amino acid transport system permease protein